VGEQRRVAHGLAHTDLLDHELLPVARMPPPVAGDVDRLARMDVGQRAGEDHLLTVVADAREHREVAAVEAEAHRRDLDRQRLHRPDRTRPSGLIRWARCRVWAPF
jgi:hypothetical protein